MMKVFRMNDVVEWVAAETLEDAVEYYRYLCIHEMGMDPSEVESDNATEETRMNELLYTDDDDGKITFAQKLSLDVEQGRDKPYLFATTEF